MCYVCSIHSATPEDLPADVVMTPADVGFADQFKMEFRREARADLNNWLARRGIALVVTEEILGLYDELMMLGCRSALRILTREELVLMLDERAALRGDNG